MEDWETTDGGGSETVWNYSSSCVSAATVSRVAFHHPIHDQSLESLDLYTQEDIFLLACI